MKRLVLTPLLFALLFVSPAFAATMNTFASQKAGSQLVQLIPGRDPLLTDTFAGTGTFPNELVFETQLAPIGTFTISYSLTIGGQQLNFSPPPPTACANPAGCFVLANFNMPKFYHPTAGTLVVNFDGSAQTFDFTFQSTVPEPTSLLLVGSGLAVFGWWKSRKFRRM